VYTDRERSRQETYNWKLLRRAVSRDKARMARITPTNNTMKLIKPTTPSMWSSMVSSPIAKMIETRPRMTEA
jgi:hypothetical protein